MKTGSASLCTNAILGFPGFVDVIRAAPRNSKPNDQLHVSEHRANDFPAVPRAPAAGSSGPELWLGQNFGWAWDFICNQIFQRQVQGCSDLLLQQNGGDFSDVCFKPSIQQYGFYPARHLCLPGEELRKQRRQNPHKPTRSRKPKKPRSREAKNPRSQKAKKPKSPEAKKPKSQEDKKPKARKKN